MASEQRPAEERQDSIPISAIEHYAYCPRQALLIYQEGYFESNIDTIRGDLAHAAVDRGGTLTGHNGAKVWRSLPVWSTALGVHGICDTVHFTPKGPIPVEHKSGTYRPGGPVDLQVAAQVVCLREMFGADVPHGEVFAGHTRRRYRVVVDDPLVARLHQVVAALRHALSQYELPPPVNDRRCDRCSLRPGCVPDLPRRSVDLFRPRDLGRWDG